MECQLAQQGIPKGSCEVATEGDKTGRACDITLRYSEKSGYERLIKSLLLSRPEDYLSIYQSGCNHTCLKCHSHEFSKVATGEWMSVEDIAGAVKQYKEYITVHEPREAATSWHAHRLCKHCGSCLMNREPSANCPRILKPDQVVISPQGFGPARNIVAFTGGDILCRPDFYTSVARRIKEVSDDLWVLLETNGYGLTEKNLAQFAEGGIDSFWLDIKAYSEDVYRRLCGTTNKHILESVRTIVDYGFTLEVLTLFIPGMVETEEHEKIAQLVADVDPDIPFTLLAFFPFYQLLEPEYRSPTAEEMAASYISIKEVGLTNLRLGNLGVFVKDQEDMDYLSSELGPGFF
ncbi:MAG: radical SAM protein [Candidatus Thorarchaeota archaeon]|nr:MAG: radical SAM protein [Candidatus Thorarchaeota archaeon]